MSNVCEGATRVGGGLSEREGKRYMIFQSSKVWNVEKKEEQQERGELQRREDIQIYFN